MAKVKVLTSYCKGCGLCVPVCPRHILAQADAVDRRGIRPVVALKDAECTGCGNCAAMCPDAALEVEE